MGIKLKIMQARELRIGDFIEDDNGNLVEITPERLQYITNRHWLKSHHPIPLTEEWLLKLGLKYYAKISTESFFGGVLYHYEDEWVVVHGNEFHFIRDRSSSEYDGSTEYRTTEIKYVHQLQNIYQALAGEELVNIEKNKK